MFSTDGNVHTEGGGPDGAIVYLSFRGDYDHVYDILDKNLDVSIHDFHHDFRKAFERWRGVPA